MYAYVFKVPVFVQRHYPLLGLADRPACSNSRTEKNWDAVSQSVSNLEWTPGEKLHDVAQDLWAQSRNQGSLEDWIRMDFFQIGHICFAMETQGETQGPSSSWKASSWRSRETHAFSVSAECCLDLGTSLLSSFQRGVLRNIWPSPLLYFSPYAPRSLNLVRSKKAKVYSLHLQTEIGMRQKTSSNDPRPMTCNKRQIIFA